MFLWHWFCYFLFAILKELALIEKVGSEENSRVTYPGWGRAGGGGKKLNSKYSRVLYYKPISDTPFELHVFWLSAIENRIKQTFFEFI